MHVTAMTKRILPLLLIIILLASSCLKSDTSVKVNPDGSGSVSMTILVSTDAISEMSASFSSEDGAASQVVTACDEMRRESTDDVPPGVSVQLIDNADWCGAEVSWNFESGEQPFAVVFEDPEVDVEGLPPGLTGELTRLETGWRFETEETSIPADAAPADSDAVQDMMARIFDTELSFTIDLPGETVEHNADEVADTAYTWRFDNIDSSERLFVETRDRQTAAVLPIVAIVGGLGVALIAAVTLRRYLLTSRSPMPGAVIPTTIDADSPRRTRDSIIVTGALVLLLVGAPLKLFARLLEVRTAVEGGTAPLSALEPLDGLWLGFALLWLVVAHELIRRTALPRDVRLLPHHAQSATRQMVELSLFGAGPLLGWTTANPDVGLEWLEAPTPTSERDAAEYGNPGLGPLPSADDGEAAALTWAPASTTPLPASSTSPSLRTDDYVVKRGDTFWWLAEAIYGDGRHWQKIRDLNLGREVAPGVVMNERSDLSTGWTIAVPVIRKREADNEE